MLKQFATMVHYSPQCTVRFYLPFVYSISTNNMILLGSTSKKSATHLGLWKVQGLLNRSSAFDQNSFLLVQAMLLIEAGFT